MFRFIAHYGIHFLVPVAIGLLFFKEHRWRVILILWAGIVIDIDHFLATPVFDANRCSIGFHPLHSYYAIVAYVIFTIYRKTRIFGMALLIHIVADITDCLLFLHSK